MERSSDRSFNFTSRMKARVKATGEIVNVYNWGDPTFRADNGEVYQKSGLDFDVEGENNPDYWDRLLHQYAGMAMQGMMNNSYLAGEFRKDPNNGIEDMSKIITKAAAVYAHALVEKMKEERK